MEKNYKITFTLDGKPLVRGNLADEFSDGTYFDRERLLHQVDLIAKLEKFKKGSVIRDVTLWDGNEEVFSIKGIAITVQ